MDKTSTVHELDITDEIDAAIALFVEGGGVQQCIVLPEAKFDALYDFAKSTDMGSGFLKHGFNYCTLPVIKSCGTEIVIE